MISKATTTNLLDKIKSFEWCWHINSSIGGHDCWRELFQEISKLVKTKKIIERIGYTIILGEDADLVRIACFSEFDNEGTGFELFYKDSHTKAKWYIKKNNALEGGKNGTQTNKTKKGNTKRMYKL